MVRLLHLPVDLWICAWDLCLGSVLGSVLDGSAVKGEGGVMRVIWGVIKPRKC